MAPLSSDRAQKIFLCTIPILCIFVATLASPFLAYLPGILAFTGAGFFFARPEIRKEVSFKSFLKIYLFLGSVLLLTWLSTVWAYDFEFAVERNIKLTVLLGISFLLPCGLLSLKTATLPSYNQFLFLCMGLVGLLSVFSLFEFYNNSPLYHAFRDEGRIAKNFSIYNRASLWGIFLTFFVICLFYFYQYKSKKHKIAFAIIGLLSLYLFLITNNQSAQLAFFIGLFSLFFLPLGDQKIRQVLPFIFGIFLFCMPMILWGVTQIDFASMDLSFIFTKASIPHRAEVWAFTISEIIQHPFLGQGLEVLRFLKTDMMDQFMRDDSVLHPHNAMLQIWVELGFVGATLVSCIAALVLHHILSINDTRSRRVSAAVYFAFWSVLLTGYGVWQGWLLGSMVLIWSITIIICRLVESQDKKLISSHGV